MRRFLLCVARRVTACTFLIAACLAFVATTDAADTAGTVPDNPPGYRVEQVLIPMRDGVELGTVIVRPETHDEPPPIILMRTKFAIDREDSVRRLFDTAWRELAEDNYIFVLQNVRGRFRSQGQYVLYQGVRDRSDPSSTDDSTDAYDTIDWLVKNVPGNNGRVGIMGGSQPGTLAAMALLEPHPALKASSPQAPAVNQFVGDDFFHYGAFSLAPNFEYAQWSYWAENSPSPPRKNLVGYDYDDLFEFFVEHTPISRINERKFHNRFWIWDELIAHPTLDDYWRVRQLDKLISNTTVPTLIVGGWYDVQDQYGPFGLYRSLNGNDKDNQVRLVIGPWLHNEWMRAEDGGRALMHFDFGSATAEYYRRELLGRFFSKHLWQRQEKDLAEVTFFQTGSNRWRTYDSLPPRISEKRKIYFAANGRLEFDKRPTSNDGFDSYVADPLNPVPHAPRPMPEYYTKAGQLWRLEDQRFATLRPDVIGYESEVLEEDLTITGDVTVNLYASTDGTDADWVVKLIDVYPQESEDNPELAGYHYMVSAEIFRAKFRSSFADPQPLKPNVPALYKLDLLPRDHVFKKGHRIRIQVQGSWFPLFDANPGKFVNIMQANREDFVRTEHRIYRSTDKASHIEVSVQQ